MSTLRHVGLLLPLIVLIVSTARGAEEAIENTEGKQPTRAEKHYNLDKDGLAIQGYDPVSYFKEGGGEPKQGKDSLKVTLGHTTYYFANEKNRALFEKDPAKYEPAYGGWCAYAMGAKGEKVEINPKAFTITDGRLCLFYKTIITDTRKSWTKDVKTLKPNADASWEKISGEKLAVEKKAEDQPAP